MKSNEAFVSTSINQLMNKSFDLLEHQLPFCAPFNYSSSQKNLSLWSIMPKVCRRNIHFLTALMVLLSVLTTIFNITVLVSSLSQSTRRIRRRNPTMLNYSKYVISMAIADLMMGLLVLPMIVAHMSMDLVADAPLDTNSGFQHNVIEIFSSEFCIGVLTHISLFASLYTLAAASVDRFYTSSQPFANGSLRISRSSIRHSVLRMASSNNQNQAASLNITRSLVVLIAVWSISVITAVSPIWMQSLVKYRHVGHIFVIMVEPSKYNIALICYVIILAFPLSVTWLFSVLICFNLWKRKLKLSSSAGSIHNLASTKSSFNEKLTASNFLRQQKHAATTTAHIQSPDQRHDIEVTFPQQPIDSDVDDETCKEIDVKRRERKTFVTMDSAALQKLYLSQTRFLSPEKARTLDCSEKSTRSRKELYRRSWSGSPHDMSDFTEASEPSSCKSKHRKLEATLSDPSKLLQRSNRSHRKCSTSSLSNFNQSAQKQEVTISANSHSFFQRQHSLHESRRRYQRQSSVRIARKMLRTRSMELSIAKTLMTVVLTFTLTSTPIIMVVLFRISRRTKATYEKLNSEITGLVCAILILFSNSLWNSLVYGARMPYFRNMTKRICQYFSRISIFSSCCTKASHLETASRRKVDCVETAVF